MIPSKNVMIAGLLIILSMGLAKSQSDSLIGLSSSIIYDNRSGITITPGLPSDLTSSTIFFIEIAKYETVETQKLCSLINKNLKRKMADYYPYAFKTFDNEFRKHSKEYFLNQGIKYRILIRAEDFYVQTSHPVIQRHVQFCVLIQDLRTGFIYGDTRTYWHKNYMKRFFSLLNKKFPVAPKKINYEDY